MASYSHVFFLRKRELLLSKLQKHRTRFYLEPATQDLGEGKSNEL